MTGFSIGGACCPVHFPRALACTRDSRFHFFCSANATGEKYCGIYRFPSSLARNGPPFCWQFLANRHFAGQDFRWQLYRGPPCGEEPCIFARVRAACDGFGRSKPLRSSIVRTSREALASSCNPWSGMELQVGAHRAGTAHEVEAVSVCNTGVESDDTCRPARLCNRMERPIDACTVNDQGRPT